MTQTESLLIQQQWSSKWVSVIFQVSQSNVVKVDSAHSDHSVHSVHWTPMTPRRSQTLCEHRGNGSCGSDGGGSISDFGVKMGEKWVKMGIWRQRAHSSQLCGKPSESFHWDSEESELKTLHWPPESSFRLLWRLHCVVCFCFPSVKSNPSL